MKNFYNKVTTLSTAKPSMGGKVWKYITKSGNQIVLGNYTDDVTLMGTGVQVATGIFGVDLPADLRDISADILNWKWTWGHAGQTALDAVGLLPLVGAIKNIDEAVDIIKGTSRVAEVTTDTGKKVLMRIDDVATDVGKKYGDELADSISDTNIDTKNVDEVAEKQRSITRGERKPRGEYELENGSSTKRRSIRRQNESADKLAEEGYDIEMLPENTNGNGYGVKSSSSPDYVIDGKVYDCYAPTTKSTNSIKKVIKVKTVDQAENIVLNLDDTLLNSEEVIKKVLTEGNLKNDLKKLKKIIIIENGTLKHIKIK